jgi:ABC-2 type transport system permease protein
MRSVRWMLVKDLQILRRSPLLVGLLVVYPIVISLLIGLALSRAPSKPRVAIANLVPAGQTIDIGGQQISVAQYAEQLNSDIIPVPVSSREEAVQKVRNGDVLAALVIPPDIVQRLSSGGVQQADVEVILNGDALTTSYVRSTIDSQLAQANAQLTSRLEQVAAGYIDLLLHGGQLQVVGNSVNLLGLQKAEAILRQVIAQTKEPATRRALAPVESYASLGVANLGLSKSVLASVGQPVRVHETSLAGRRTPLDAFAVAVAVSVSLMFVCVLLAAGSLALEREENTFPRLVRGLVSPDALISEKVLLAAACAWAVSAAMLAGIGLFVGLDYGRVGQWLVGLAAGALAFGALGVAIGAITREVRAASLLAILLSLPLAFLALVPSGAVAVGVYDVIRVVCAVFPFKPTLEAMNAAINRTSPSLGVSLLHLLAVGVGFAVVARVALRRFA